MYDSGHGFFKTTDCSESKKNNNIKLIVFLDSEQSQENETELKSNHNNFPFFGLERSEKKRSS